MQFLRNIFFVLSAVISILIVFSATSRFTQQFDLYSAHIINPFNAKARLSYVNSKLREKTEQKDWGELRKIIQNGLNIDPYNARYYSILGLIAEAEKNDENALELYIHSRRLVKTEEYALMRQLSHSVKNLSRSSDKQSILEIVDLVELIYLRWRPRWPVVETLLPALLSDETAYNKLMAFFPTTRRGTREVIGGLLKSNIGLSFAKRLLIDWHNQGIGNLEKLIGSTNHRLLNEGLVSEAYQLFYFTLPEEQRKISSYVHNKSFDFDASSDPFNWSIRKQAGVDISQPSFGSGERSLRVRFLDKPVEFKNLHQVIRLPENKYSLKVTYTNKDVKGPKPIFIGIRCRPNNRLITEVALEKSNEEKKVKELEFTIPAEKCDYQNISMYNHNFSKSWSNRYRGDLFVHDVTIELIK